MKLRKLNIRTQRFDDLEPSKNYFLSLSSAIIYQQISTKAGDSIFKKFKALFGTQRVTPKNFSQLTDENLRSAGISPQKLNYLRDLSKKFLDKTINSKLFIEMTDEEIVDHLIKVKGVGRWTAEMFLIFGLNRKNILPMNDLGIKNGFKKVFKLKKTPSEFTMKKLSKIYDGELTKFSLYLWQSLEKK